MITLLYLRFCGSKITAQILIQTIHDCSELLNPRLEHDLGVSPDADVNFALACTLLPRALELIL